MWRSSPISTLVTAYDRKWRKLTRCGVLEHVFQKWESSSGDKLLHMQIRKEQTSAQRVSRYDCTRTPYPSDRFHFPSSPSTMYCAKLWPAGDVDGPRRDMRGVIVRSLLWGTASRPHHGLLGRRRARGGTLPSQRRSKGNCLHNREGHITSTHEQSFNRCFNAEAMPNMNRDFSPHL